MPIDKVSESVVRLEVMMYKVILKFRGRLLKEGLHKITCKIESWLENTMTLNWMNL